MFRDYQAAYGGVGGNNNYYVVKLKTSGFSTFNNESRTFPISYVSNYMTFIDSLPAEFGPGIARHIENKSWAFKVDGRYISDPESVLNYVYAGSVVILKEVTNGFKITFRNPYGRSAAMRSFNSGFGGGFASPNLFPSGGFMPGAGYNSNSLFGANAGLAPGYQQNRVPMMRGDMLSDVVPMMPINNRGNLAPFAGRMGGCLPPYPFRR